MTNDEGNGPYEKEIYQCNGEGSRDNRNESTVEGTRRIKFNITKNGDGMIKREFSWEVVVPKLDTSR